MSSLQSVQRRAGFETLEAKKLFAADLIGADVMSISPNDNEHTDGGAFIETVANLDNIKNKDFILERNAVLNFGGQEGEDFEHPNLGGQEGEPLHTVAHEAAHVIQRLGGQEGEPLVSRFNLDGIANLGGQEGEPLVSGCNLDGIVNLGGQEGEPLHTVAHEAAHVIQRLGGQEGEPVVTAHDRILVDHVFEQVDTDHIARDFANHRIAGGLFLP